MTALDPRHLNSPSAKTRPLRILYPASLVLGGAERQMLLLAAHLPKDEFRVDFLMIGEWTSNADEAVAAGARAFALGLKRRGEVPRHLHGIRLAAKIPRYVSICRRERYDIADAWLFLGYGLAAVTRPVTGIPILIGGRRSLSRYKEQFGVIERTMDAIARRYTDVIVANSEAVARDVVLREHIDRSRIRVIRNGVEIPEPMSKASHSALRMKWGAGETDLVIGVVGILKPGKGQERVIRVLGKDPTAFGGARLVLVGDGPRRSAIIDLARSLGLEDRVTITGLVPDARPYYGAFDIVVSASEAEGLPNAVLEAAAAGNAIVATDAGGTPEIVEDGTTGLLVPVGDDDALGRALTRLVRDSQLRTTLGAAARRHAADTFGVNRLVRDTAALYRELAVLHGLR